MQHINTYKTKLLSVNKMEKLNPTYLLSIIMCMTRQYKKINLHKEFFHRIFIDGLSGMSLGLFSTLIIGLIISQIAKIFPSNGTIFSYLTITGKILTVLTGAGIGCAVAHFIGAPKLGVYSSIFTGLAGAYAPKIIASATSSGEAVKSAIIQNGGVFFVGPGDPLSSFAAALIGAEISRIVYKKTKLDILVVPFSTIISGLVSAILLGPGLSKAASAIGGFINNATVLQPFIMGIIISVSMGMLLTLPVSSAAIAIMLGLEGISGGAACAGCSAQMIGFAVISFADNGFNGFISQALGTSMLQIPNIAKNPRIWLPAIIASAITGPISSCVFRMKTSPEGSGMGTSGLVGQIATFSAMRADEGALAIMIKIIIVDFILPGVISYIVYKIMKNKGLIKDKDMLIAS